MGNPLQKTYKRGWMVQTTPSYMRSKISKSNGVIIYGIFVGTVLIKEVNQYLYDMDQELVHRL